MVWFLNWEIVRLGWDFSFVELNMVVLSRLVLVCLEDFFV